MKAKKLDYLIELTYDKSYKGYVAEVINLFGCMSQGKTKKEALENVEKAIRAFVEAAIKQNKDKEIVQRKVETPIPLAYA